MLKDQSLEMLEDHLIRYFVSHYFYSNSISRTFSTTSGIYMPLAEACDIFSLALPKERGSQYSGVKRNPVTFVRPGYLQNL